VLDQKKRTLVEFLPANMGLFTATTSVCLLGLLPSVYSQDAVSYDFDTYGVNDAKGTPAQTYMSNTNVKPPQMQINKNESGLAEGYVFLGMDGEPTSGQNWPTIYGITLKLEQFHRN
jgi:hypothetical protein